MYVEVILLVCLVFFLYKKMSKPPDMPPGSYGFPIIGKLPPLDVNISVYLAKLKQKYGNIFTAKWGSQVLVFLADPHVIRKALNHPDLQGRPQMYSLHIFNYHRNLGVIFSTGSVWKENRRFMLHNLRNLGMGKTRLEDSIIDEVEMLVKYLEQTALDKPTEIDMSINVAVLNVIWQMLASKRYDAEDETILTYNNMVAQDVAIIQGPLFLFDYLPWIMKILPKSVFNKLTDVHIVERNREIFYTLCKDTIVEHLKTLDKDNPRDVVDHYLLENDALKNNPDANFREEYLDMVVTMGDMFAAGSETTSSTLRWIILYMAVRTDIQEKAHEVLDAVVSKSHLPSLEDRENLAYIDALILDVLRLSSLVGLSVPHSATATIELEGYVIPKDTIIMACLELSHKDPAYWEKPHELYPEHFLDVDGKLNSKHDAFMPFSTGRRQCLGESVARMELFLFATAILHKFNIAAPPGVTLDTTTDPSKKIFNQPKPFKVVLKKRF